jgi:hypothetical protein
VSFAYARLCNRKAADHRLAVHVAKEELGEENKHLRKRIAELEAEKDARERELMKEETP